MKSWGQLTNWKINVRARHLFGGFQSSHLMQRTHWQSWRSNPEFDNSDWLNFKDGWKLNQSGHDSGWKNVSPWQNEDIWEDASIDFDSSGYSEPYGCEKWLPLLITSWHTRVLSVCWGGLLKGQLKCQLIDNTLVLLLLPHPYPIIIITSLSLAKIITFCFTCYDCQYYFLQSQLM